jgi:hypothetical protein
MTITVQRNRDVKATTDGINLTRDRAKFLKKQIREHGSTITVHANYTTYEKSVVKGPRLAEDGHFEVLLDNGAVCFFDEEEEEWVQDDEAQW